MTDQQDIKAAIFEEIRKLIDGVTEVNDATALLGSGSALDSMRLVELCVSLEDRAQEMGFEFDWTSETAMSKTRSMFRTAGSLASEFLAQMEAQR